LRITLNDLRGRRALWTAFYVTLAAGAVPCIAQSPTPGPSVSSPTVLGLEFALLGLIALILLFRLLSHRIVLMGKKDLLAAQKRIETLEADNACLAEAQEQMRHHAEHDDLTGLWNHRIIVERLHQEVDRSRRESTPLSLILVDLDHFKTVNDTFGHASGDVVLKRIGSIFQRSTRSYDWVGRFGGEEFLLILPGSGIAGARSRAEQLRKTVEETCIFDGERDIRITASFGVASGFPQNYDALLQASDAAMYRAKASGRNCVMVGEVETTPVIEPQQFQRR
jgi:diguanylate cyclase (GGDEF)-like protein